MKRLIAPVITFAFLALAASAFAQIWHVSTRVGSRYTAPSTTGTCKVTNQPLFGTAEISCGAAGGSAVVHYPFTLRSGCGPTVSPTVDSLGATPRVSAKTADHKVDVAVRVSGRGKTFISLVSISYYCG
jgi:hypothetical protein